MLWRNNADRFGAVAMLLHWLLAAALFGVFGLGLWMVGLTYYDPWYHRSPVLHAVIGLALVGLTLLRFIWRWATPLPAPLPNHSRFERFAGRAVHLALYAAVLALGASGYLVLTAEGEPFHLFGQLSLPPLLAARPGLTEFLGKLHAASAWTLIGLAGLHAAAALKHHFIDRDRTLLRMLGR
ncbi:MAG TPA: cytochrome b [Betaproteobacteria bacterium]|nr:cytochrome b [Betaproteobacteria bacterium]